jgi:hypothetical protein
VDAVHRDRRLRRLALAGRRRHNRPWRSIEGLAGIRAQTFVESKHEFRIFVDPTNACVARAVPNQPTFPVVAGEPVELVCVVPTDVVVGQPLQWFVRGQDRWGNPTPRPEATETR